MLLSTVIDDFLWDLRNRSQVSPLTLKNYTNWLKRLLAFAPNLEVKNINAKLIRRYKQYLLIFTDPMKGARLKPITQNYHLIALRALLEYLNKQSIPAPLPEVVELLKQEHRQVNLLSFDDIRKIVEAPKSSKKEGVRDRCLLEILSCTGLLVSNIVKLNCRDISIDNLSPQANKWLETYLMSRKDTFSPLFIRFQGTIDPVANGEKMRLTPRSVERIVKKYGKKVGIKATPQLIRESLAANLLQSGQSIKSVQKILGHHSPSSTKVYLKSTP